MRVPGPTTATNVAVVFLSISIHAQRFLYGVNEQRVGLATATFVVAPAPIVCFMTGFRLQGRSQKFVLGV